MGLDINQILGVINGIISIVGPALTLAETKTWLEDEASAEQLRALGHENDVLAGEAATGEGPATEGSD